MWKILPKKLLSVAAGKPRTGLTGELILFGLRETFGLTLNLFFL
jgi:hypothetical protein